MDAVKIGGIDVMLNVIGGSVVVVVVVVVVVAVLIVTFGRTFFWVVVVVVGVVGIDFGQQKVSFQLTEKLNNFTYY